MSKKGEQYQKAKLHYKQGENTGCDTGDYNGERSKKIRPAQTEKPNRTSGKHRYMGIQHSKP